MSASSKDTGKIVESSSSEDYSDNKNIEFHSIDESQLQQSRNKGYSAEQQRKNIFGLLQNSDLEKYVQKENNDLVLIINHATGFSLFNTDDQIGVHVNDFINHFDAFRALFILPDEKNILNDLHRTFITNLSHDNLIKLTKKTEKTDFRLQLWVFTQLMDLYTDQIYNEAKIKKEEKESDIRVAIVDLGKKIDLVSQPGNDDKESQKSGIDYVGLIFKAINLINYLPNATEESYRLTKFLHDIKLRVDMYAEGASGNKQNEKTSYVSDILQWYTNISQRSYATQFSTLRSAIESIRNDIKYKKKPLFTKDRLIFFFIAACSGIIANYGLTKIFILVKRLKKKVQMALKKSESDSQID